MTMDTILKTISPFTTMSLQLCSWQPALLGRLRHSTSPYFPVLWSVCSLRSVTQLFLLTSQCKSSILWYWVEKKMSRQFCSDWGISRRHILKAWILNDKLSDLVPDKVTGLSYGRVVGLVVIYMPPLCNHLRRCIHWLWKGCSSVWEGSNSWFASGKQKD